MFASPVCFVNAAVCGDGRLGRSVRFRSRVLAVDEPPQRGDTVVDLDGATVWPGLINAHDHLELNHYGRVKCRDRYANAREWIEDMRPRLQRDPIICAGRAHSLADRLFIGGLKNLLAGATTVAHHNPFYPELRFWFPVRVVRRYGWAHSFFLEARPAGANGEPGGSVPDRYAATASEAPFFIHLAEGTDDMARQELRQLDELHCLAGNTVLVHGVGLDLAAVRCAVRRGAWLVWCPASNMYLLGRSLDVRAMLDEIPGAADRVCLATDSRLTGSRDLLDELRCAAERVPLRPGELIRMVTTNPARALRLPGAGRIVTGAPADFLIVPNAGDAPPRSLLGVRRGDVLMVMVGGRPMIVDPELGGVFAARRTRACLGRVDGVVKLFDEQLAGRIRGCRISEPGVEVNLRP